MAWGMFFQSASPIFFGNAILRGRHYPPGLLFLFEPLVSAARLGGAIRILQALGQIAERLLHRLARDPAGRVDGFIPLVRQFRR